MDNILVFIILLMATWRISSLLTDPNNEEGPFGILARFRDAARRFTNAVECPWCMSIWVGLGFTFLYWYLPGVIFWVALPFALSAGAIAWDKYNG
jgi:hypothetical protein